MIQATATPGKERVRNFKEILPCLLQDSEGRIYLVHSYVSNSDIAEYPGFNAIIISSSFNKEEGLVRYIAEQGIRSNLSIRDMTYYDGTITLKNGDI